MKIPHKASCGFSRSVMRPLQKGGGRCVQQGRAKSQSLLSSNLLCEKVTVSEGALGPPGQQLL